MDPRFLRTFVTVVRLGSFSRAAEELGYTQSAVSQHIGVLEADLDTTLLTRRPVAPTEAGARLLEHAEPILLRLDAARADVARVAGGPPRSLRIGTTPLACAHAASLVAPALTVTVRVGSRLDGRARGRDRRARRRVRGRRGGGQRPAAPAGARADRGRRLGGGAGGRGPGRPPAAAAGRSRSRTSSTRAGSTRRPSARRSTSSPRSRAPKGSNPRWSTTAATSPGCWRWSPRATGWRCSRAGPCITGSLARS